MIDNYVESIKKLFFNMIWDKADIGEGAHIAALIAGVLDTFHIDANSLPLAELYDLDRILDKILRDMVDTCLITTVGGTYYFLCPIKAQWKLYLVNNKVYT